MKTNIAGKSALVDSKGNFKQPQNLQESSIFDVEDDDEQLDNADPSGYKQVN